MKTLIEVTHQDIVEGRTCIPDKCPVALAVKRCAKIEDELGVSVGVTTIRVGLQKFHNSNEVENFVVRFDRGQAVEPFTFELDLE
jgi:hypothetical protein